MKLQIFAYDKRGKLNHAGDGEFPGGLISRMACEQNEKQWRAWRKKYLAENPGDYPLRKRCYKTVTMLVRHPNGAFTIPNVAGKFVCIHL